VCVCEKESVCVSGVSHRVVPCLVCECVQEGESVCERERVCVREKECVCVSVVSHRVVLFRAK